MRRLSFERQKKLPGITRNNEEITKQNIHILIPEIIVGASKSLDGIYEILSERNTVSCLQETHLTSKQTSLHSILFFLKTDGCTHSVGVAREEKNCMPSSKRTY